MLSQTAIEVVY